MTAPTAGSFGAGDGPSQPPKTTPNPDLADLIDRAWRTAPCPKCGRGVACRCLLGTEELRKYRARAVVAALTGAGRLLPTGTGTRTEWAVRVDEPHPKRREKRGEIITHFPPENARRAREVWAGWTPMQRTVRTFADGSTLVGPWRPVPSTPTDATGCTEPTCSAKTELRCARCGEPFCADHLFATYRDGDLCAIDYNDIDDRLPEGADQ